MSLKIEYRLSFPAFFFFFAPSHVEFFHTRRSISIWTVKERRKGEKKGIRKYVKGGPYCIQYNGYLRGKTPKIYSLHRVYSYRIGDPRSYSRRKTELLKCPSSSSPTRRRKIHKTEKRSNRLLRYQITQRTVSLTIHTTKMKILLVTADEACEIRKNFPSLVFVRTNFIHWGLSCIRNNNRRVCFLRFSRFRL